MKMSPVATSVMRFIPLIHSCNMIVVRGVYYWSYSKITKRQSYQRLTDSCFFHSCLNSFPNTKVEAIRRGNGI